MSCDLINECVCLNQNIKTTSALLPLSVPMLLFVSNGEETDIDKNLHVSTYDRVIDKIDGVKVVRLNCSHFVLLLETDKKSEKIILFTA